MKKFLAVLMTLAMLLTSCAFAAETEAQSARIVLDDIVVYEGENVLIDMEGIGLSFNFYESEDINSLQMALTAADKDVIGLGLSVVGTKLLLGMTGVSNVYSVEADDAVKHIATEINLVDETEEVDLTSVITEEDQQALAELALETVMLIAENTETDGTEEIDGVTYNTSRTLILAEDMDALLQKVIAIADHYPQLVENTGFESFAQMYETFAPSLSICFETYENENEFNFDLGLVGNIYTGTEEERLGMLEIYVENVLTSESTVDTHVEVLVANNDASYTLAFNMQFVDNNESSWVPASDAPIDLFEALEDEAQMELLASEALTTGIDALLAVAEANETIAALLEAEPAE